MKGKVLNEKNLTNMAEELFKKVNVIKNQYPSLAREIDRRETSIRLLTREITNYIEKFNNDEERELIKILVAHGLQKIVEEELARNPFRNSQ